MRISIPRIWLTLGFIAVSVVPLGAAEPAEAEALFANTVHEILKAKCVACHGMDSGELKGELDLSSRLGMERGGESEEPIVVPGKPDEGLLMQAITWEGLEMPPKENDRLTAKQIAAVRDWILGGAPWPRDERIRELRQHASEEGGRVPVRTSGGTTEDWTSRRYEIGDLWVFQPLLKVALTGDAHPIDELVWRRQERFRNEKDLPKLERSPATRRELLIRMTYDLTGLPPTESEMDGFLRDQQPGAVERVIDRLLASKRYGERWAQHWLDVVRYADSAGFANDFERPHAWRYRDYVVRSLNEDKAIDRFIVEQLAGDELDAQDPDCLVATGFLRMGPWEHTGMAVEAVTRQSFLDDVTNAVGETFLGINMSCFKCHDHKFDPLPTRDYYRFQAIFAPTQFGDRALPFQSYENTGGFEIGRARTKALLTEAQQRLAGWSAKAKQGQRKLLEKYAVKTIKELPKELQANVRFTGLSDLEKSLQKITNKRVAYYRRELARYEPFAYSVYNGPFRGYAGIQNQPTVKLPSEDKMKGETQEVFILRGGALESPGEKVSAGVLSAVQPEVDIPADGRRLALAEWLTDAEHPITARVFVNRVWHYHFGTGLFATPNAVGKMGSKPTHPELLDELTRRFVKQGWSLKQLHRLIMTSETYQQSTREAPIQWREADPNNENLTHFRPRRLTAEELRDALLFITGELNLEMGGPGCFPEINWDVALQPRQIMGTVAPAYQPSRTPSERHRRTIYAVRIRTLPDPMLEVMNRPGSDFSCAVRNETTVTPQVFALFNGQFAHDRSIALADRIAQREEHPRSRVTKAFQLLLHRSPTDREQDILWRHYEASLLHHERTVPEHVALPTEVTRGMVEELTGNLYEFLDELTLMKDYVPDKKPWQVDAATRALAELCLVLINSNEFAYVY